MTITRDLVIKIHQDLIARTGGLNGIRDEGLLDSSIASAHQTFGGNDLYPDNVSKSIRLSYNLIMNHPFVDGNKRIGMHMLILSLRFHDFTFKPSNEEVIKYGLGLASHLINYDEFSRWVNEVINRKKHY